MAALTAELIRMRVASWAIESVEPMQDRRDRRIIADSVRRLDHRDEFVYDHRPPHSEPLCGPQTPSPRWRSSASRLTAM